MSAERISLIESYGADLRLVSAQQGGFVGAIELAEKYARDHPGAFLPRQFSNCDNASAHELTTGPEIWWQLEALGREPDAFVAGVGTGGTVMGVSRALRALKPGVLAHPLEPENSPTLRTGHQVGHHRIQGISDEFVPALVELDALNEIVSVDDGDAILMTQRLSRELGLGVGISSGANLLGAVMQASQMGPDATVVTVFSDDNKKYLSTALRASEPVKESHWSPRIELVEFTAHKRVCVVCCEGEGCDRFATFTLAGGPYCSDNGVDRR
jgi:cysteine synthase A